MSVYKTRKSVHEYSSYKLIYMYMCVCMRACVRACVRASVRACVRAGIFVDKDWTQL